MFKYLYFSLLLLALGGCLQANSSFTRVAPGIWRGVLVLEKYQVTVHSKDTVMLLTDQFQEGELPFNFEITYLDDERFYVEFLNGSERIRCDSIRYGRDRTQARDTMNMYFPEYESYIHAEIRGGVMQGEWVVTSKENYRIPFYAHAARNYRFTPLNDQPAALLSGEWAALFGIESPVQDKAVAEFKQSNNHLEGTFRTETGDYRYLEGTVQGRKFWLSCFDGAHAFLFSGSIRGDSLQGEFRSGTHFRTLWTAWRDSSFRLGNPDSLTALKPNAGAVAFSLKNPQGTELTFPGPKFDQKIKIFTIMGTWCPNCRDEQNFLTDYLKNNPEMAKDLAIVGFSFERGKDPEKINAHLAAYQQEMGIPFEIVYAGAATTAEAERVFPNLNKVMAFPTMIILDKNNQVRRIHTGFDGPATSKYAAFKSDFETLMQELRQ